MDTETKRTRPVGAGRKAAGPRGQARTHCIGFNVAPDERDDLAAYLRSLGLADGPTGVRTLVLDLVATAKAAAGGQLAA